MGKNKLKKFAELLTLDNVVQCTFNDTQDSQYRHHELYGNWGKLMFHNSNPIVLELGCGRGEYTVGLAQLFPDKNFIGVDIKGARLWAGAKQANEQNLSNVAFLRTNIEVLPFFFAPDEISEIWITFPDPQMKKATKRLTSTYFLKRYQQFVKDNGIIHLKTDSPFLYEYTSQMLQICGYNTLINTADLYNSPYQDVVRNLKTHYEKQWLDRGLTIKYIQFQLKHQTELEEPELDIEKDTYRSYGRNYNTINKTENI